MVIVVGTQKTHRSLFCVLTALPKFAGMIWKERDAYQELIEEIKMLGGCNPNEYGVWLAKQRKTLLAAAPEFRDSAKAERFQEDLRALLRDYGFTDDEIDRVDDARVILFIRDFLLEAKLRA